MFLASDSPGSTALLTRLWELQPPAVVRAMALLRQSQPQSLLRILDLCKELGALETILAAHAASRFALDLATVAQRTELINLEEWLKKSIKVSIPTNAFVKSVQRLPAREDPQEAKGVRRLGQRALGRGTHRRRVSDAPRTAHAAAHASSSSSHPAPPPSRRRRSSSGASMAPTPSPPRSPRRSRSSTSRASR